MENFYCGLIFVFILPAIMITWGLVYISKKDWAWRIAESMLRTIKPHRTAEWEFCATINGLSMLVGGRVITFSRTDDLYTTSTTLGFFDQNFVVLRGL